MIFKLQPAIFLLSKHVIRFHELPAETMSTANKRAFVTN